jgi:hypothetical protein
MLVLQLPVTFTCCIENNTTDCGSLHLNHISRKEMGVRLFNKGCLKGVLSVVEIKMKMPTLIC